MTNEVNDELSKALREQESLHHAFTSLVNWLNDLQLETQAEAVRELGGAAVSILERRMIRLRVGGTP